MREAVTVAIPSYNRGAILIETLDRLFAMSPRPDEIIVVDQTIRHPDDVEARLTGFARDGRIRWIRLDTPSIPGAMNRALREARNRIVLFVDDDVDAPPELIARHAVVYEDPTIWAVVGQVLQPGEVPQTFDDRTLRSGLVRDLGFRFNHTAAADVESTIACNLSVDRDRTLAIGGFDENFVAAAHRFETDFARRVAAAGGRVRFEPSASLRHLKLATGGLRSYGNHLAAASPAHSVGDYYFALLHAPSFGAYALDRLRRNVLTRFLARRPWLIPSKLVGEIRGILLARRLHRRGRRLADRSRE